MTEYLMGPDRNPVGPDVDNLSPTELDAINKCAEFFAANADRVRYFTDRVKELGRSGADTVIVVIDVDDPTGHGALLADLLMPGEDWQQYRDKGDIPVARGLVAKEQFPGILADLGYLKAAEELARTDELSVVVLHVEMVQVMVVNFG